MILCSSSVAKKPFYISHLNVSIYSLEELCYLFLYHGYWMNEEIFDQYFIKWVREELQLRDFEESLIKWKEQGANLTEFLKLLFQATDYFTGNEKKKLIADTSLHLQMTPFERQLRYADKLFADQACRSAIREYLRVLDLGNGENPSILAGVWYRLGCAYGSLLYQEQAISAFEKAYELSPMPEILEKEEFLKNDMASNDEDTEYQEIPLCDSEKWKERYRMLSR